MILEQSREAGPTWDGHLLLLHRSEAERVSGLVSWVRRGLANSEKVICGQTPEGPEGRSVAAILGSHGINVTGLQAEGSLAVIPFREFFPAGGQLPVVQRALSEGHRAVRITCEASAALAFLTWPTYMHAERGVGEVCRARPLSVLCQYRQASMRGRRLRQITEMHLDGVRERLLATCPADRGLALAGEIDMSNETVLASILQAAMARAGNTFRLDLSRLQFLSAAACRVLDEGTQRFRDRGGRVLLISPPNEVAHILRLAGLDRLPNVQIT